MTFVFFLFKMQFIFNCVYYICLEGSFIYRDQKMVSNLLGAGITGTYKLSYLGGENQTHAL